VLLSPVLPIIQDSSMMKNVVLLFALVTLGRFSIINAADLCQASVQGYARAATWNLTGDMLGVVMDLWINNFGFCYITSVDVSIPPPFTISSYWGMTSVGGRNYRMNSPTPVPIGSGLGGTYGPFGLVASVPYAQYVDAPIYVIPTVIATNCSYCPGSTGGSCTASVSLSERVGGSWESNGKANQIWDLTLTNTGLYPISSIRVAITPAAGTSIDLASSWNLAYDNTTNLYAVSLNGALYSAGSVFAGAGFIITGTTSAPPMVTLASAVC